MPRGIYIRTEEVGHKISEVKKSKHFHHTDETKQKMSLVHKVQIPWNKGKTNIYSEETKQRMRESQLNKSEETRQKMSKAKMGHLVSEETKRKIGKANSIKNKGKHHSIETKWRISEGNKGKIVSEETKFKISKAQRGEKSCHWQGGITLLNELIRKSFKYRQWRSDIFTHDDFTCQKCGVRGGYLYAHHIKSFSSIVQFYEITTLEEALDCQELWNINNGITLCEECHKLTENYGNKKLLKLGII